MFYNNNLQKHARPPGRVNTPGRVVTQYLTRPPLGVPKGVLWVGVSCSAWYSWARGVLWFFGKKGSGVFGMYSK
jgi:hypothetical protein